MPRELRKRGISGPSVTIYCIKRKEATRICRRKKREYLREKIKEIETSNNAEAHRKFYNKIKQSTRGFRPREYSFKDRDERVLTSKEDILRR